MQRALRGENACMCGVAWQLCARCCSSLLVSQLRSTHIPKAEDVRKRYCRHPFAVCIAGNKLSLDAGSHSDVVQPSRLKHVKQLAARFHAVQITSLLVELRCRLALHELLHLLEASHLLACSPCSILANPSTACISRHASVHTSTGPHQLFVKLPRLST